ncbi:hypothetical protein H2508_01090 [Parahaliea sp. F7430]|uniref:Uncharacterized protein n=1 Tax=Sediminihaliea albiluteola TaxID=2758564 RepID=A0A7W2YIX7_9GAMM|nr:hypothetical protein [Sediminihaliea albiluteola]MBA6411708.1 hypothetical protein [Sediminihaliea albiluteola]
MNKGLAALEPNKIDSRLGPHLEAGELVLWQNQPRAGSLPKLSHTIGALMLLLGGGLLASSIVAPNLSPVARYTPATVAMLLGSFLLFQGWRRRASLWCYAITDRRLLSVFGDKLIRSLAPEQLDKYSLKIQGDTVYWMKFVHSGGRDTISGQYRAEDGRYVGFHGQTDPQATKSMIESWRRNISQESLSVASTFVKTMSNRSTAGNEDQHIDPAASVQRIRHLRSGLYFDIPADWRVAVRSQYDGPLILFGIKLLPRFIRQGPERPYGDSEPWNALSAHAAPEAALDMLIYDRPLATTLDSVLKDPFTQTTGAKILHSKDQLSIGPFKGFAVVRKLPAGSEIKNIESLSGPAMLRQVWLGNADCSIEVSGYALERQSKVQEAIDAMIASISLPDK